MRPCHRQVVCEYKTHDARGDRFVPRKVWLNDAKLRYCGMKQERYEDTARPRSSPTHLRAFPLIYNTTTSGKSVNGPGLQTHEAVGLGLLCAPIDPPRCLAIAHVNIAGHNGVTCGPRADQPRCRRSRGLDSTIQNVCAEGCRLWICTEPDARRPNSGATTPMHPTNPRDSRGNCDRPTQHTVRSKSPRYGPPPPLEKMPLARLRMLPRPQTRQYCPR